MEAIPATRLEPIHVWVMVLIGSAFLFSILWSFFPNLVGLSSPAVDNPWRLGIPLLVALVAGLAVGSLVLGQPVKMTLLTIAPGVGIGSLLGLFAALEPHHLLIVLAMATSSVALAMCGGLIGGLRPTA